MAGKTVIVKQVGDIDWTYNALNICYQDPITNKEYTRNMNIQQFVEAFYETEIIEDLTGSHNINTLEEAKNKMSESIKKIVEGECPNLKFSEDGRTVTAYDDLDNEYNSPLETYTVEKKTEESLIIYELYCENGLIGTVFCNSDGRIDCAGTIFFPLVTYSLQNFTQTMITLNPENPADDPLEISLSEAGSLHAFVNSVVTYTIA